MERSNQSKTRTALTESWQRHSALKTIEKRLQALEAKV